MSIRVVEYQEHEWGASPKSEAKVALSDALELIRTFPSDEATEAAARFDRSPRIGFVRNRNDLLSLTYETDARFTVTMLYRAATFIRYGAPRAEAERLLTRYFEESHFGLFRSLVRSGSGVTLYGSTLAARVLRFIIGQ